ncbi:MAG: GTPase HflX [Deltaproteobacteria bacterium]
MTIDTRSPPEAAVLVAVQLPGVTEEAFEGSVAELARLVHTLGHTVIGRVTQKRSSLASAAVIGEGKLAELAAVTGGSGLVPSAAPVKKDKARLRREEEAGGGAGDHDAGTSGDSDGVAEFDSDFDEDGDEDGEQAEQLAAEAGGDAAKGAPVAAYTNPTGVEAGLVVVDHEITPSQARNLERATGATVMDRTGVIVEIFHRHAHSREAKLQVEIARLMYVAPRMREGAGGGDRQRGGIGGKGAGESGLELDRRKIRDRIAELREELAAVQKTQDTRRARRRDARRVALVGYTNAGKSSLMRALTASEVLVADKLFATLDTTVRALQPETKPRILVSDTVGFIKKLPHDLVASFRSTLDEALEASLLLYVVDASDTTFRAQLEVTRGVLDEIGATAAPSIMLLNKIDRVSEEQRALLTAEFPDAMQLSAKDPGDIDRLRDRVTAFFDDGMVEGELFMRYGLEKHLGAVHELTKVLDEAYDERGARFKVLAHPEDLARLRALLEG